MFFKNALANYLGRAYVIVVGIAVLPLYMKYLGDESYGLVGLFALVQSVLNMLSIGLSPTLGREAAKAKAIRDGFINFYKVLISYELIFLCLSLSTVLIVSVFGAWFSKSWLTVETLTLNEVSNALILMVCSAAFRLQASLYRSGIMGLENQVFVNLIDVMFSSFRFLGGLFLVAIISNDITIYFLYQVIISCVEFLIYRAKQFSLVPPQSKGLYRFDWFSTRPTLRFALGIAYTAGIWILITQIDKAVLTKVLTLSEFGYYTLVALISSGILQISTPLAEALRPRLTSLAVSQSTGKMYQLYLLGMQIVAVICWSAAFIICFNSYEVIYAWTGNDLAAQWGKEVLQWSVLGYAVLSVGAFQYYLQFAHGQLRLHVIGSSISACVQVPVMAYCAYKYGALGAAQSWFCLRLLFFLFWAPVVHSSFRKGLHKIWLLKASYVVLIAFILSASLSFLTPSTDNRLVIALVVGGQFVSVSLLSVVCVRDLRRRVNAVIVSFFNRWALTK